MATATDRLGTTRTTPAALPGTWALGLRRGSLELRQFFRQRDQAIFTFAFPIVFLFLFASIFSNDVAGAGITASQLYVPSMIAAGIMSTSFQSLGISIAIERDNKQLRRLRGTPMPPASYFLGKVWLVLVTGLLETVALLAVGVLFYDIELPTGAVDWLTFGWIFVLGLTGCALLGIAISSLPKTGQSAARNWRTRYAPPPAAKRSWPPRWPPAWSTNSAAARTAPDSPSARRRCCGWSPRDARTRRSDATCSSANRR
ncbi:ABC transporter permease [Streptomyces niveus]|uniref:ABC transporter permease n=1 Tax=Streptomyces niveus TaxID=193462 RepID=UPI00363A5066